MDKALGGRGLCRCVCFVKVVLWRVNSPGWHSGCKNHVLVVIYPLGIFRSEAVLGKDLVLSQSDFIFFFFVAVSLVKREGQVAFV